MVILTFFSSYFIAISHITFFCVAFFYYSNITYLILCYIRTTLTNT
nr:MAG TPA: hypothetical protein [Caudoviricetes sp.]